MASTTARHLFVVPFFLTTILACNRDSEAQKAQPKPAPAVATPTAAPTAVTAKPAWTEALLECLPGKKIDDCQSALQAAGIKLLPRLERSGEPHVWFGLEDPYETIFVQSASDTDKRIVLWRIQAGLKPGRERQQLTDWFRKHLGPKDKDAAVGNLGCGADGGGSSWKYVNEAAPEIQYAIETHPTLQGISGKEDDALDDYFVKTKSKLVNLCFFLPKGSSGQLIPVAASLQTMIDFLRSPLLRDKTHPLAPVASHGEPSCAAAAEAIVTASAHYQNLLHGTAGLKLMAEGKASQGDGYDLRAFTESPDGEVLTVERFRVDFAKKQLLRYDPIEDTYAALPIASERFDAAHCR